MKLSIHKPDSNKSIMQWKQAQKLFPAEVELIQQWFNEKTGTESRLSFYEQPVWHDDLVLLALYEKCGLRVEIDAKWVPSKKSFRYIYMVNIGDSAYLQSRSHYDNRISAENHALVHALEYLKLKPDEKED